MSQHDEQDAPRDEAETEAHLKYRDKAEPAETEAHAMRSIGKAEPADVEAHEAEASDDDDSDVEGHARR